MSGKVYTGERTGQGAKSAVSVVVVQDDEEYPLPSRLDLREHSVNLEWGYGMGGPAQLALAILADATGSDAYAERHHHWFKQDIVMRLAWDGWELSESRVHDWIAEHHPIS
ncbi:MAG: hypothetical protein F4X57_09690 [Chloroflexi bacterium]|nr:hypothetical protein [Chloroflexota bacterium]